MISQSFIRCSVGKYGSRAIEGGDKVMNYEARHCA